MEHVTRRVWGGTALGKARQTVSKDVGVAVHDESVANVCNISRLTPSVNCRSGSDKSSTYRMCTPDTVSFRLSAMWLAIESGSSSTSSVATLSTAGVEAASVPASSCPCTCAAAAAAS